jgi:hypothetical protein
VDEIGTFIKGLSKDKLAVAALNKQGEVVEQVAGVSDDAAKAAVSQGADEVVVKSFKGTKFKTINKEITMSDHAAERAVQRGISPNGVSAADRVITRNEVVRKEASAQRGSVSGPRFFYGI